MAEPRLRPAVPHGPNEHSHGDWLIANDACPHPTCPHHRPLPLPDFLLARIAETEELASRAEESANDLSASLLVEWVLAECEAKRRIVEMEWHHLGDEDYAWGMEEAKRQILAVLALPYADHPDYREEWRP